MDPMIKGLLAGGAAGTFTDACVYAIDAHKLRVQTNAPSLRVQGLFRGLVPVSLMGSFPSFGVFFAIYEPAKRELLSRSDNFAVNIAGIFAVSALAAVPSGIISVPADVLKKQLFIPNHNPGFVPTLRRVLTESGPKALLRGWEANLARDMCFAGVKVSSYEVTLRLIGWAKQEKPTSSDSSLAGFLSGIFSAILTNPFDVANTRMKSGHPSALAPHSPRSLFGEIMYLQRSEGTRALFKGLVPRSAVISLGSAVFWSAYAVCQRQCDVFFDR